MFCDKIVQLVTLYYASLHSLVSTNPSQVSEWKGESKPTPKHVRFRDGSLSQSTIYTTANKGKIYLGTELPKR